MYGPIKDSINVYWKRKKNKPRVRRTIQWFRQIKDYQKKKTMIGWPCLKEQKSIVTRSNRRKSCRKKTFGKTKNA